MDCCNQCNRDCGNFLVKTVIHIKEMTCENCVVKIKKELTALKGVEHIDVDLNVGEVKIFYDDRIVNPSQLKDVIQQAGFNVDEVD